MDNETGLTPEMNSAHQGLEGEEREGGGAGANGKSESEGRERTESEEMSLEGLASGL